jgi:hypothetical protein
MRQMSVHPFPAKKKKKKDNNQTPELPAASPASPQPSERTSGRRALGTPHRCDVCGTPAGECGSGGGCTRERDNTLTKVCDACVREFCFLPETTLTERYGGTMVVGSGQRDGKHDPEYFRRLAVFLRVGCDPEANAHMERLPRDVPFELSCFRKNAEEFARVLPTLGPDPEQAIRRSRAGPCWACGAPVHKDTVCTCARCRIPNYCSAACSKDHAPIHKAACDCVANLRVTH